MKFTIMECSSKHTITNSQHTMTNSQHTITITQWLTHKSQWQIHNDQLTTHKDKNNKTQWQKHKTQSWQTLKSQLKSCNTLWQTHNAIETNLQHWFDKLTTNIDKSQHIITNHTMTKTEQLCNKHRKCPTHYKQSWPEQLKIAVKKQLKIL